MDVICPHHKIIHTTTKHPYCLQHGHCLFPGSCLLFSSCPLNTQKLTDKDHINQWTQFFKS